MVIYGSYDPLLVALSVAVAIFASFTALNLAGRLMVSDRSARPWWLFAVALALGGGIWSMHFVGMLAFSMPMPATYGVRLTLLSLLLPIMVVGIGIGTLTRFGTGWRPLLASGVLVGLGVVIMHYSGMAAMRIRGVDIDYDPVLVAASIAVAVGAATAALWLAFRTSGIYERLAAALVMGIAISGMHYTAMAAAEFTMHDHAPFGDGSVIPSEALAVAVVGATALLLVLALTTAFFDRQLATLTAREASALQQSERRYRALIESASDIILVADADGMITYESSSARHILGYRSENLIGRRLRDFVPPERAAAVENFLAAVREQPGTAVSAESSVRSLDGGWRDFEVVSKNLLHDPAIGGIVLNLRDMTERKRLMAELEKLSQTDALTGALNRRGFMKAAEVEFERLRRSGNPTTLVMIDIDHFKHVNDTYGHAAGDLVLAMVAEQCRSQIRGIDILGRFGGEEFVILLIDAPMEAARAIVDRLREGIAASRIATIRGEVTVTASFGLASVDPQLNDLETTLRLADEALYEAKRAGRNCIKIRA